MHKALDLCKDDNDDDGNKFHWKEEKSKWMLTLFVGSFLLYSARITMSISIPAISEELEWNKQVSGMALSAFFCGYVCTNIIGGHIADRIGGETVICYTGIGWASLTVLLPFIARFHFFILSPTVMIIFSRFVTGLSQGVFYPALSSITAKHITVTEKGSFTGFIDSGTAVGSAVTGFFGSIILEYFNWPVVFIVIGSLSVLWILWLRYLILCQNEHSLDHVIRTQPNESLPWCKVFKKSSFWALFIAYFSGNYCYFNFLSWAPVYFHDSFPEGKKWLYNTIPWLVAFLLANISGYIGNVLTRKNFSLTFIRKLFASLYLLGFCLCSFLLIYVKNFQQALFLMSMNIGVHSFAVCSLSLNSQDLAPKYAGTLQGFVKTFGALAGVIGVYLSGYILKDTKQWTLVFLINSGLAFLGFLSYLVFGSGEQII